MKILILNWRDIRDPLAGGAEAYLHQIGRRLAREHEVFLFCRRYSGSSPRDEIAGIKVIRRGGSFTLYPYFILSYLLALRKERFDVVVDGINGVPFFTPLFVKRPKIAVIFHIVGREIFFRELPFPLSLIGLVAEKMIPIVYRRVPVVVISDSTKDEVIRFGIPQKNISLVYCGIENVKDAAGKPHNKSFHPSVAYFGRIKDYKQLDHLVKAFAQVNVDMPNSELVIAGRGDYSVLADLVESLGLSQSVRLVGEVSDQEKEKILGEAWVFVTPSLKEGWGITVIEANNCGTPAIAYNVPGLRDSIRDGETGLLVTEGKIDDLAEAISRVLKDAGLRQRLTQNAITWASRFNWDNSAEGFIRAIGGAVDGGRPVGIGNSADQE